MGTISICDQKTDGADCPEAAALSYRWDWGAEGSCCQRHALLLQQTAQNLSRNISLTPVVAVAAAPVTRDERTQLMAARLSAEAEADEIKARSAELYRQNVDLTRQVNTLVVKNREANSALEVATERVELLEDEVSDKAAQIADLSAEVQRLRVLATFTPPPSSDDLGQMDPPTPVSG